MESFRNAEGKPRQRTVCTLGRLEVGGEVDTLIASLQRAQSATTVLSSPSALEGLRFAGSRHAGDVWALSELWRSLGFDDLATQVRHLFPSFLIPLAQQVNEINDLRCFWG